MSRVSPGTPPLQFPRARRRRPRRRVWLRCPRTSARTCPSRSSALLDETGRLEPRRDGFGGRAGIGCSRRGIAPREIADPCGMSSLDRNDLRRCGERALRQVRRLTVVCGDTRVLEEHRGVEEPRLLTRRRSELERRRLVRAPSECPFEELDVVALVAADHLGELTELAAQCAGLDRLPIERRLEALVLAVALVLVTIMAFFSTQVEIFRADGTRQTGVEAARDALQRAMTRVAPVSEAASAVGAPARERIASAGAPLKGRHHARGDFKRAKPEPDVVQAVGSEPPPDEDDVSGVPDVAATLEALATARAGADLATLKDRVDVYLESVTSEGRDDTELDGVEANADGPSEASRTPADDELEVLKAKLGKAAAPVDDSRTDEVETLKAKLAGKSGRITGSDELKRKLTAQSSPVEGAPPDADAALKAKLRAGEEPSNVAAPDAQPPSDATPPPASVKLSFSSTSGKHRRSRRRRDQWFLLP